MYSRARQKHFVASVVRFLRNSPLSSETVHTSQFFSVKLQQPTTFIKWLRQALHCQLCSMLVTRSLWTEHYFCLPPLHQKRILDSTNHVMIYLRMGRVRILWTACPSHGTVGQDGTLVLGVRMRGRMRIPETVLRILQYNSTILKSSVHFQNHMVRNLSLLSAFRCYTILISVCTQ